MLAPSNTARRASAHIIVLGNEKGGSGKSTTAMHLAVGYMKDGARVATIDLDSRQRSLFRYVENRRAFAERTGLPLELPASFTVARSARDTLSANEADEFTRFADAMGQVEQDFDVVIVDTPGSDSYLMRLAHSMADTLITPVNDSMVDLDVMGRVDRTTGTAVVSHYAEMVRGARRQRRLVDQGVMDWIVVRNRLSTLESRNQRQVQDSLTTLGLDLGFRLATGISERMVYREFFEQGLTALDPLDETITGMRPGFSHLAARQEVRALMDLLKVPVMA